MMGRSGRAVEALVALAGEQPEGRRLAAEVLGAVAEDGRPEERRRAVEALAALAGGRADGWRLAVEMLGAMAADAPKETGARLCAPHGGDAPSEAACRRLG